MNYVESKITEEELNANKYVIKCCITTLVVLVVVWILNELRIFINELQLVRMSTLLTSIFLLLPILYHKFIKETSKVTKYILLASYMIAIFVMASLMTYHLILAWGIPFMLAAQYRNSKLSLGIYIVTAVFVLVSVIVGYRFGLAEMNCASLSVGPITNFGENMTIKILPLTLSHALNLTLFYGLPRVGFVTVYYFMTQAIIKKSNLMNEKTLEVSRKNEEMLENVMVAVERVREGVDKGTQYIDELDCSSEDSLSVYKELVDGNVNSSRHVIKQSELADNITELIKQVEEKTDGAIKTSSKSLQGLSISKESMETVRTKADKVIKYNEDVMKVIEDFVKKVQEVKTITEGINDISEQTNLLSLNASIESARAGESGKGFAVVADEIRKLADETGKLTGDIDNIVRELSEKAMNARSVVDLVVNAVDEENKTIDQTMDKFVVMEKEIEHLDVDMNEILSKAKEVVDYNKIIIEHVKHLSSSTEDTAVYTKKAFKIIQDNKEKTHNTKVVMDELLEVVNELV